MKKLILVILIILSSCTEKRVQMTMHDLAINSCIDYSFVHLYKNAAFVNCLCENDKWAKHKQIYCGNLKCSWFKSKPCETSLSYIELRQKDDILKNRKNKLLINKIKVITKIETVYVEKKLIKEKEWDY